VRRGHVSNVALAMQPGYKEGSGPRMASAARGGGCRNRSCIVGRTRRLQGSLWGGVLATTNFIGAENSCLRVDGVRFFGLPDRIGRATDCRAGAGQEKLRARWRRLLPQAPQEAGGLAGEERPRRVLAGHPRMALLPPAARAPCP
jgi:hypothetical protein